MHELLAEYCCVSVASWAAARAATAATSERTSGSRPRPTVVSSRNGRSRQRATAAWTATESGCAGATGTARYDAVTVTADIVFFRNTTTRYEWPLDGQCHGTPGKAYGTSGHPTGPRPVHRGRVPCRSCRERPRPDASRVLGVAEESHSTVYVADTLGIGNGCPQAQAPLVTSALTLAENGASHRPRPRRGAIDGQPGAGSREGTPHVHPALLRRRGGHPDVRRGSVGDFLSSRSITLDAVHLATNELLDQPPAARDRGDAGRSRARQRAGTGIHRGIAGRRV